ncbi:Gfo/Idh/MocA family protein [Sporosarcina pasteurii]|uniref:1,5-anhydro-D-fructose reductase n=1 Tax=Sporosarcina pasteurii TaxID=1474 RepID=A0A380BFJ0_SPOPA|nr:Gfo/Idh/MocA family oxidoreductase [Sporosarcina pasteurii]MDS9472476.1 Gfo/Idh/MocA family oxidoreductase [Sporosarcina pasteurii]QBQ06032.1 Gfo/Idh/MocA family oxidoreductase [Sporosarcina pasteurii]SUI99647.1 1,5-anhydro-D-fructose reductase [Sporosarcina pasteurii]
MKMKKVRWGIIGCGDVTEVKSGPAFQKVENSELVAVMRRTGHLAKDYAERHGVPKWYDDADNLINDPEVDAIYIATPPSSHKEYAIKAAKAGKPIYVEKPMALNFDECNEMIVACKEAGVPLYVAYYRRAMPRFLKIKELLDNNAIGEIRFVITTQYQRPSEDLQDAWRVQPEISGGGLFFDMGSHTLDILDFLLGPIREVKGFTANQAGNYRAEDIVTGAYVFESGIHGTGNWCFSAYEDVDVNEIIGSEGKLTFSTLGNEPVLLTNSDGITEFTYEMPEHVHQPLVETIVEELTGTGGVCQSNGTSGARTNMVMDKFFV